MRRYICILAVLLAICVLSGTCAFSESGPAAGEAVEAVTASTMRLMRADGTVSLADEAGEKLAMQEGMRLYSGQVISTGEKSRAGVSLDDAKAVTVGEESVAALYREGRKLALSLEDGAMFFSVSQPLEEDESFEIRTSTMILGIRGTSGAVEVISDEQCVITLASGHAMITAVTGEEQRIGPGRRVVVTATPDGTTFLTNLVSPRDFPALLLEGLSADELMLSEAEAQNESGFRTEVLWYALLGALQRGDLSDVASLGGRLIPAAIRADAPHSGGGDAAGDAGGASPAPVPDGSGNNQGTVFRQPGDAVPADPPGTTVRRRG